MNVKRKTIRRGIKLEYKNTGIFLYGKIKMLRRAVAYCDLHKCYLDGFNVKHKGCNIKNCKHKKDV